MVHIRSQLPLILPVALLSSCAVITNLAYDQSYCDVLPLSIDVNNAVAIARCSMEFAAAVLLQS